MVRKNSIVTVYVRHKSTCNFSTKPFYRGCDCPKFLRWSAQGKQYKKTADTRSWWEAEKKATEQQEALNTMTPSSTEQPPTILEAVETFILSRQGEGAGRSTITKLRHQISGLEKFLAVRGKTKPSEITPKDLIEFRGTWSTWKSGVTRQKAQTNVRGFVRHCCRPDHAAELCAVLKTIKLSKEDHARLAPRPFSEKELKKLLAQVPITFPDKAARMTALIHCMVSTGLAIRDTIQLERKSLVGGWLRIKRQKTNKDVMQKLDRGLLAELAAVTNGNPRYVFWNGTSLPNSATGGWQTDLRKLMEDAGLWIKGNLSHRFRDTAVDFWLGAGCSMTEVAGMLGDTVAVCEKHYADLASKRMEERLSKIPTRSW